MVTPFKFGLGGVVGSGNQWISWIALDDVVYSLYRLICDDRYHGPVNVCNPTPVTNYELTKTLGRVLGRPTVLPIPGFVAKLAFGEMAESTILSSCLAKPQRLLENEHVFKYSCLEEALRHTLGFNSQR